MYTRVIFCKPFWILKISNILKRGFPVDSGDSGEWYNLGTKNSIEIEKKLQGVAHYSL